MKKLACLLLSVLMCVCLAAVSAEEELTEVRCDEWRFTVRIPAGLNAYPESGENWNTDEIVGGGLVLSPGGNEDLPRIKIMRRNRFFCVSDYLGIHLWPWLEQYGDCDMEGSRTYVFGGKTLYGSLAVVLGENDEEFFRELRLIPVSDDSGTEFIARYTAETESSVFSLLDTVIRYYQPDEAPETPEPKFLPEGHSGEPDLQNGTYLLRVEDTDRIEADGYFTAALYLPDYFTAEDVCAMRPGDTVLIMDRVLTITDIEPNGIEDDGSWYEAELIAVDRFLTEKTYCFTLMRDGNRFWPYFGNDNHSASRIGEVRVRVPQADPVEYYSDSEDGLTLLSGDLLGNPGSDPAMFGFGWNEYTHRCYLKDGCLIRVETWDYPYSPEDPLIP